MIRPVRRYYGTVNAGVVRPVSPRVSARALARELSWRVALLAGGVVLAWQAWAFVTTAPGFAVRRVDVEGCVNADVAQLVDAAGLAGRNVFTLDLERARRELLGMPWVADAALHRSLPDVVRVRIRETRASCVVRLGGVHEVLDDSGRTITTEQPGRRKCPELLLPARGADAARTRAAATLAAVRESAPELFAQVETVDATRSDRLALRAAGQPLLLLAGPESADELLGWLEVAAACEKTLGRVEHVDARWRDRLFIGPQG